MSGFARWPARAALAVVLGIAGAGAGVAQTLPPIFSWMCPPDGLTGACCQPATPNLPALVPIETASSQLICFQGCMVGAAQKLGSVGVVNIAPTPDCGVYTASVVGPFTADVKLHYTRHWLQFQPGLGLVSVYRYVAVGLLTQRGAWSCALEPVPQQPFVYGYVDFVYRAGCKPVAMALVLGHNCDYFIHNTFSSCPIPTLDPVGGHPGETSVVVAPGANFVPNPALVPPPGPSPAGAQAGVRRLQPACEVNEQFSTAGLANLPGICPCGAGVVAPQFTPQELRGVTKCQAAVNPAAICPYDLAPPTHSLFTWSIGAWTAGAYPGLPGGYRVWLTEGYLVYLGSAASCEPPRESVWYGAETAWIMPLPSRRVDLVDDYNPANNGPIIGGPGGLQTRVLFLD